MRHRFPWRRAVALYVSSQGGPAETQATQGTQETSGGEAKECKSPPIRKGWKDTALHLAVHKNSDSDFHKAMDLVKRKKIDINGYSHVST